MAARGTRRSNNTETAVDPAETNQPATARRYSDGEAKPVKVDPQPEERPYSEAVTKEHREALREAGVVIRKGTVSEQAATTT